MSQFATLPSLNGTSVLVTGGASGIGRISVEAFAFQGAKVVFLDRDAENAAIVTKTTDAPHVLCYLPNILEIQTAIATLADQMGPFQVLANNAARDDLHNWQDVTPEYWNERMDTNLRHMFFAIQSIAPGMIEAGGGSIINMGSNSWWEAGGGFPAYATAKAAVHGLTRTMARDLGQHRIMINTVVPGRIMTERQKD